MRQMCSRLSSSPAAGVGSCWQRAGVPRLGDRLGSGSLLDPLPRRLPGSRVQTVTATSDPVSVFSLLVLPQVLMGQSRSMTSRLGMEWRAEQNLSSLTEVTSSSMATGQTLLRWSPPTPGTPANQGPCYRQRVMPLCTCGTGWTSAPLADASILLPALGEGELLYVP